MHTAINKQKTAEWILTEEGILYLLPHMDIIGIFRFVYIVWYGAERPVVTWVYRMRCYTLHPESGITRVYHQALTRVDSHQNKANAEAKIMHLFSFYILFLFRVLGPIYTKRKRKRSKNNKTNQTTNF